MWWSKYRFPETKITDEITSHLENGGVLVNAKGAAVDVLSFEKIRSSSIEPWKDAIFAYAMKHTIDDLLLTISDIEADYDKAQNAFKNSEYPKTDVILVHFSNRSLQVSSYMPNPKSVLITKRNINGFVGPFLGSLLTLKKYTSSKNANKPGGNNRSLSTVSRAIRFLTSKMK